MGDNLNNLVLLGPPGAGKGTQAVLLAKTYKLLHISTGQMLREAVKGKTSAGEEIQQYMNAGELVPDYIVTRTVIERMSESDAARGVILDGYPRTCAQAKSLDTALKQENRSLTLVLYFKTSEEIAIQRLSGRRVCPKCSKNYHVTNMPPKKFGVCDVCKTSLVQRQDDKPETVKKRFSVYKQRTEDLIAYYTEKGLLQEVNGDISAEQLFNNIGPFIKKG